MRVIYSLLVKLGPGGATTAIIPLDRQGQAAPRRCGSRKDGMPRPPIRRTVDLRPGDEMYFRRAWRTIAQVSALRDAWLQDGEAVEGKDGYVYRVRRRK